MQRLLYISSSRQPITTAEVEDILRTSRRNNAANGVTGLLVTGGRRFLQVLEGERNAVETAFARIADDPRHYAVVTLSNTPVTARLFSGWAMGHVGGATGDDVGTLTAGISDPTVRAYFEGFGRQHAA